MNGTDPGAGSQGNILGVQLDHVRGYLADGYNGVKIKVGKPDLAEDLNRARAVRDLIGPALDFMVDANYSMTVEQAIEAAR